MAYILVLGDHIVQHVPNLTWEYVKSYFYPQYKRKKRHFKNESLLEMFEEELALLAEGSEMGLNSRKMKSLSHPSWLDIEKLKRGQEFAKTNYFSISYSNLVSLFLLFAHDRSLRALIFTRRSDDIQSAYRRYMSTIHRVKSWYEDDLSDPASSARKHIQVVNNYHLSLSSKLNMMSEEEFICESNLRGEKIESCNHTHERVRQVLDMNKIEMDKGLLKIMDEGMHLSQSHMVVTQFGFMGLVVLSPEKFGIKDTQDLEAFIHLWLFIGYLLGVEDKYNLCYGSLEQVRKRCRAVLECVLKPCLQLVSVSWEHMSICASEGINQAFKDLIFETMLAFLLDCIDLKFDHFYGSMKLSSRLRYHFTKFLFDYLIPRQRTRDFLNRAVEKMLEKEKIFS